MHLVDGVACSASADMVDGGGVLPQPLLLGELLVEGEHGPLLLAMDVACSSTAGGEESVRWGRSQLDARGWALSSGSVGDILGVDASDVSGTASSSVVVVGDWNGWVRLGDAVGWHFDCFVCCVVVVVGSRR